MGQEKGWNTLIVPVQTCMSKFISPNSHAQTKPELQKGQEKANTSIVTAMSQSHSSLQLCYQAQK